MIKNNYHTHVLYCNHATGDVFDYVKKAIEFKFNQIGITDHAPILESFMSDIDYRRNWCEQNMKIDMVDTYLNEIKEAKEIYNDKILVLSGFETEYLPEQIEFYKDLRSKVDYLNLGIHYYKYNDKIYNTYSDVNYKTLEGYVNCAIDGMKSGIYNTLVHPDLFMFSYENINGERKFDEAAIAATKRICEAAIRYNIYLEINANGLKNSITYGDGDWLYPYYEFWEIAATYKDLKIIIGADAHNPLDLLNKNVISVCEFAEKMNINVLEEMEINH